MEHYRGRSGPTPKMISDEFNRNDQRFRDTMERIFQKYSHLDDQGPDVCLTTMTFTSDKGTVPLESHMAEKELEFLQKQLKQKLLPALEGPQKDHTLSEQQMDVPLVDDLMENINSSQWYSSETSQLSVKSVSSSRSYMWSELSQPEDDDPVLEKTLQENSKGSTLLDCYPSLLNQIGEACHRQHVNKVANAVLRKYHRRRWQSSQSQHRSRAFSHSFNRPLNRSRPSSLTVPKPTHNNVANHQKRRYEFQGTSPHKSKTDFSLLSVSNSSVVSTACFYSPRRSDERKETRAENQSHSTGQLSNSKSQPRPVRVLDLSTPPSSISSPPHSLSPDLNQTYIVEPMQRSDGVPTPVFGTTWSPMKMARMSSLANQQGSTLNSSPTYHSGLHKYQVNYPAISPSRALSAQLSQQRSPLKTRIIRVEPNHQTSLSYLRQTLPVIHSSEVYQSPYKGQRCPLPHQQENLTKQLKRQPSFSSCHYPSSFISQRPSRQIDIEFMKLYHHFVCGSSNPTSSCNLCKGHLGAQSPAASSKNMSALSLTPVRSRLKKRHREPEVVESLRFKRFRESCSPHRTSNFWPKQQAQQQRGDRYENTSMVEPSEEKYTWNRALLLQCPSPGFLRPIRQHQKSTSESSGKRPNSRMNLLSRYYSPSLRDSLRFHGEGEAASVPEAYAGTRSPVRTWDQHGASVSPRLSRRQLLYGPLQ